MRAVKVWSSRAVVCKSRMVGAVVSTGRWRSSGYVAWSARSRGPGDEVYVGPTCGVSTAPLIGSGRSRPRPIGCFHEPQKGIARVTDLHIADKFDSIARYPHQALPVSARGVIDCQFKLEQTGAAIRRPQHGVHPAGLPIDSLDGLRRSIRHGQLQCGHDVNPRSWKGPE